MANKIVKVTSPSVVTGDSLASYNVYTDKPSAKTLVGTMTPAEASAGETLAFADDLNHNVSVYPVGTTTGEFNEESNVVVVDLIVSQYIMNLTAADEVVGAITGLTNLVEDDYFEVKYRLPASLDRINFLGDAAIASDYIRIIEGTSNHPQCAPLDGAAVVSGFVSHIPNNWYVTRIIRKADGGGLGFQTGSEANADNYALSAEQVRDNNADVYNLLFDLMFSVTDSQGGTVDQYSEADIEYIKIKRGATVYVIEFTNNGSQHVSVPAGITIDLTAATTIANLFTAI